MKRPQSCKSCKKCPSCLSSISYSSSSKQSGSLNSTVASGSSDGRYSCLKNKNEKPSTSKSKQKINSDRNSQAKDVKKTERQLRNGSQRRNISQPSNTSQPSNASQPGNISFCFDPTKGNRLTPCLKRFKECPGSCLKFKKLATTATQCSCICETKSVEAVSKVAEAKISALCTARTDKSTVYDVKECKNKSCGGKRPVPSYCLPLRRCVPKREESCMKLLPCKPRVCKPRSPCWTFPSCPSKNPCGSIPPCTYCSCRPSSCCTMEPCYPCPLKVPCNAVIPPCTLKKKCEPKPCFPETKVKKKRVKNNCNVKPQTNYQYIDIDVNQKKYKTCNTPCTSKLKATRCRCCGKFKVHKSCENPTPYCYSIKKPDCSLDIETYTTSNTCSGCCPKFTFGMPDIKIGKNPTSVNLGGNIGKPRIHLGKC